MRKIFIAVLLLVVAVSIWGCVHKSARQAPGAISAQAATALPACGPLLHEQLAHVYHPNRLQVRENCKLVTGVVELVRSERDGDYHIRLRPDPGQGDLTNERNDEKQDGDLVVEPICEHNVTQEDAIDSCRGFSAGLPRPRKGMHVRVIGPFVLDLEHGWMEIHPAVSIEEIP